MASPELLPANPKGFASAEHLCMKDSFQLRFLRLLRSPQWRNAAGQPEGTERFCMRIHSQHHAVIPVDAREGLEKERKSYEERTKKLATKAWLRPDRVADAAHHPALD
jgi:hypothetical protein